jgi:multiple sugar transport system permease protein
MTLTKTVQRRQGTDRYDRVLWRDRLNRVLGATGMTLATVLIGLGAIFMIMPFFWMVLTSFKSLSEINRLPITWLPDSFLNLRNWQHMVSGYPSLRWLWNSVVVSVISITSSIFFCSLAGYAFAKLRFRGRNVCFAIVLAVLMVPFEVTFLPLFVMLSRIDLTNTYLGIIFPNIMSALGVFIFRQFMMTVPDDYLDAARIDGASEWAIFYRVVVPLASPAIVTVAVLKFIMSWNSFLWPLVMASNQAMMTLPVGMQTMVDQFIIDYGLLAATSTLMVVPPLILFLVAQRWVISGMVMSGLKG